MVETRHFSFDMYDGEQPFSPSGGRTGTAAPTAAAGAAACCGSGGGGGGRSKVKRRRCWPRIPRNT